MKRSLLFSALALSCVFALSAGCGRVRDNIETPAADNPLADLKAPPDSPQLQGDVQKVVEGNTRFGLDLYSQLRAQKGNLFLSPFSITTALAMTAAGARGDTAAEMHKVLQLDLPADRVHPAFASLLYQTAGGGKPKGYELAVANALFAQSALPFKPPFLTTLKESYGAPLREVDFKTPAARRTINDWAARHTRDRIKNVVEDDFTEATQFVLINALYFKGKWDEPFKDSQTKSEDFHRGPEDKVKVKMMHQRNHLAYAEADGVQILDLPYENHHARMLILLPKEVNGLPALEKTLSAEKIQEWRKRLTTHSVDLTLPRFNLRSRFELESTLAALGMQQAFGAGADLSGASSAELLLSRVVHEATVEVDEEGTVAAAVTYVEAKKSDDFPAPPPAAVFRADHPFLFLILDKNTGSLLFLGRVADPSDKQ